MIYYHPNKLKVQILKKMYIFRRTVPNVPTIFIVVRNFQLELSAQGSIDVACLRLVTKKGEFEIKV